jgi:hypothetical protein
MQKPWYILSECKQKEEYSDELNEKMAFYASICADKKPYFFGYNYPSLMKEYRETANRATTNARQKFRMELQDMIAAYERGDDIPQEQREFIERFFRNLKLDSSKSTCNMICWAIEDVFDGKKSFSPEKIDMYTLLRRSEDYSPALLDRVVKTCKKSEKKYALKCAIEFLINKQEFEDDEEYRNVDYGISDVLSSICNNEEILCDLLLDYCYKYNGNKEILWTVCGETLVNRLMEQHELYYPTRDEAGEFEVQGKKYTMRQYVQGGEYDEV